MTSNGAWRSVALDLGSTRLKLAALDAQERLQVLESVDAPTTRGTDLECEFDADELDASVSRLLARARKLQREPLALGIASQRSTFVAWNANDLRALTPAISWRDRRATQWCASHSKHSAWFEQLTGLRLSPHYLGPKLAHLLETGALDPDDPSWRVGTLDAFCTARRRALGERHVLDASMAARTLLFDPRANDWSREALALTRIPRNALPDLVPTCGTAIELSGGLVRTTAISDQGAAFLAVARPDGGDLLVNLGTGGFVLRERSEFTPAPGYLCGTLLAAPNERRRFALEGTINAGAAALERIGGAAGAVEDGDLEPELFCAPDETGVGAPHWRAEGALAFSRAEASLAPSVRRRAFLEGLVFRVREIVDALDPQADARVALSGGVSREPFVAPALAALLERPIDRLEDGETTLLGVARIAAGLAPYSSPPRNAVAPPANSRWLHDKYGRWRAWHASHLAALRTA